MVKTKVCIVEDEMLIAVGLAETLKGLGYDVTTIANNYTMALQIIEQEQPDILLLDIQLGGHKDGVDLAWEVKKHHDIPFIFLTANADLATVERVKQVAAQAYLVKPYREKDLYTSIELCLHNFSQSQNHKSNLEEGNYVINDCVFIKQGKYFHKVKIEDILYLEADNIYLNVHTTNTKYLVRSNLQDYMGIIGDKRFLQVHRGYAVNVQHVQMINTEYLVINGLEIPIGRAYRNQLLSFLKLG